MIPVRPVQPLPGDSERLARLLDLIDRFANKRVIVVGDLIADEYVYGQITRVSREAPVLILKYDREELVPGGSGNAASNVAALGGRAESIGVCGSDDVGRRVVELLRERGVNVRGIVALRSYSTPLKTRILAGGLHSAKQQVVRIDREATPAIDLPTSAALWRSLDRGLETCDAVLVSDYGFGLLTPALVGRIRARIAARSRRRPVPILIDSRHALLAYQGLTACTPNESEVEKLFGISSIGEDLSTLEWAGRRLRRITKMRAVLITRGSRGMALVEARRPTVHIPISGSDEIADVTGAGDTVIATMTIALAAGASFLEAAYLANYAGGIVVMKRGTATVGAEELRDRVRADHRLPDEQMQPSARAARRAH